MNKRGTVVEFVLHPLFMVVVAVMVLLSGYANINAIGSSPVYREKYYSANNALLISSLFALRKDVNVAVDSYLPPEFGIDISPNSVTVFSQNDEGRSFFFEEDPLYALNHVAFRPSADNTFIYYKSGNFIGLDQAKTALLNFNAKYCEQLSLPKLKAEVHNVVIERNPVAVVSGDATVTAHIFPAGLPMVKLYINPMKESEQLACLISQSLAGKFNVPVSIIPVNTKLLAPDDLLIILASNSPALFIEARISDNTAAKAQLWRSIREGVTAYGVV